MLCAGRFVTRRGSATAVPSTLVAGAASVLVGGQGFAPSVVTLLDDALASGVAPEPAMAAARTAQGAYEGALRNGATEADAARGVTDAAAAERLDDERALLVTNALYGEVGGEGRAPDARGVAVGMGADGHRYLHLTGDGRRGEAVTVAGTDQTRDRLTNVAQGLGFIPPQYSHAAADARAFQLQYPGGEIVGHSLGGGLATYAGSLTGLPTRVFNPAGLGDGAIREIHDHGVTTTLATIEAVIIDGETVDVAQGLGLGPRAHGDRVHYAGTQSPSLGPLAVLAHANELHRTPYVIEAMRHYPPREFERVEIRSPRD